MQRPSGATGALLAGAALLVAGTLAGTAIGLAVDGLGSSGRDEVRSAAGPFVGPRDAAPAPVPGPPRVGPPTDSLDPADRLRLDGLGPVRVGMTVADASRAAAQPLETRGSGDCERLVPASGRPAAGFLLRAGRVVRVDVEGDSPVHTLSGVGIGTPVDEVRRRYGARIVDEPDRALRFVPDDDRFSVVFESDGERVVAVRGGYAEVVRDGSCRGG